MLLKRDHSGEAEDFVSVRRPASSKVILTCSSNCLWLYLKEEVVVDNLSLDLPSMYGDHHVTEVRHLLLELPGVSEVYASSSFQIVEVTYDEAQLSPDQIKAVLGEAGYLGEIPVSVERSDVGERENGDKPFFRHSVAYVQTGNSINFAQQVPPSGRPLWPCPGMGPIKHVEEELTNG